MSVTITKITKDWSRIILNPAINDIQDMLLNHEQTVVRVVLINDPEALGMVKIYLSDGNVLELHFSVGVIVNGTTATSNSHLIDLIEDLFIT